MFDERNIACGARHESQMEGYSDVIESKDITMFSFNGGGGHAGVFGMGMFMGMAMGMANGMAPKVFTGGSFYAGLNENNKVVFSASGGNSNRRDGTRYIVKFECDDTSIFKELQEAVDKYDVTKGNGHCVHVDGLPSGLGDLLSIEYASGEKVYKTSNQTPTISPDASYAIYDIFHRYAQKHGFDFNTAGSNVQLYDDADEEYLQGTWKGERFGRKIEVIIEGNHITIKEDDKVTDDNVEYTIFEGSVVTNKLKEGKDKASSDHDYEFFNGVSMFKKKNYFTITGYFLKESYSTCDLHNFDKKKPEDES